jgi:hypothetical protein
MTVRFVEIEAASVFNLTSPRYLPQLSLNWYGRREWFNEKYEPVRDICEHGYIAAFNAHNGHYDRLTESVLREGFRNPIMLTAGRLLRRKASELPPAVLASPYVVCEYVGGSRLYVAAKLGLKVPAIINDMIDIFPDAPELSGPSAVLKTLQRPSAPHDVA